MIAGDADRIGPVAETAGGAVIGKAGGETITILATGLRIATSVADADSAWQSLADRMD